jgi:hypothetical protein
MSGLHSHWRNTALACLLLILAACGGNSTPDGKTQTGAFVKQPRPAGHLTAAESIALSQNFGTVLPPHAYALLGSMSRPAAQPASGAHGASAWLPQAINAGLQYDPTAEVGWMAKSGNVTVGPSGAQLAPAGTAFPDNFAFIIYRYDNLWDFDVPLAVKLEAAAGSTGNVGVAMYDWAAGNLGRWEPVFYGPAESLLSLPLNADGTDYTNAEGNLAFVVFCLGPATLDLTQVTVTNYATNIAPYAQVSLEGSARVDSPVTFNASQSGDMDGSLAKFEFDPENTGTWIDNGSSPMFEHTYSAIGMHTAKVRVTDNEGKTGPTQLSVLAMPVSYNELEGNDLPLEANSLPSIPFENFSANCGDTGGNDGDQVDIFSFEAEAGEELTFTMLTANQSCTMQVSIVDAADNTLAWASGFPTNVHYEVKGDEATPLYLKVETFSQDSDYLLSGTYEVRYDEFEFNDTVEGADGMWEFDDTHVLTSFDASLGSGEGYPGNDGDNEDYFRVLAGALHATLDLTMTYSAATGNLGISLLDSEGDLLANSATGSGSENLNYIFQADDEGPFFLHCVAASGYSDYEMNGSVIYNGSNYDEAEPNDDEPIAGELPALPYTGFSGNVGYGGAYDDDGQDYYTYQCQPGDVIDFTFTLDNPASKLNLDMWDVKLFQSLGEAQRIGNVIQYRATVPADAQGDIVLVVYDYQGDSTNYEIEAQLAP